MSAITLPELPAPSEIGKRLQAVRKRVGKTQDDVAQFLGIARTTVTAIEKGERRIQPMELIRLAEFLGCQVTELLKHQIAAAPLAVQLRAAAPPGTSAQATLEADADTFQSLCEDYAELEQLCKSPMVKRYPGERVLGGIAPDQAAEDIAQDERNRLGLGDGPILNLRDTLEREVGLRVFYLAMPAEVAGMFAYDQHLGGCIAVNQRHPENRRRLSLAHEYAHFLTSRLHASVDLDSRYRRLPESERFAVAFAPAFLMPAAGVSRRFNDVKAAGHGRFTHADLLMLAHYFGVSVESLTRRLEVLRLVPRGTWERIKESGFQPAVGKASLGLVDTVAPADLLPVRYLLLSIHGYRNGLLTEGQFAAFLRVDPLEARRVLTDILGDLGGGTQPNLTERSIDRRSIGPSTQ